MTKIDEATAPFVEAEIKEHEACRGSCYFLPNGCEIMPKLSATGFASKVRCRSRMTWDRFQRYVGQYIPKVRACHHPHPNPRYAS